ncbi:MAG TPA: CAP domain-containing protein [Candidatus Levybacteria bacterium]|nr:CAP domain-containing protein [Candidatus Levybacteria bacterium]
MELLRHLLSPTRKNNFRARVIQNSSLVILTFLVMLATSVVFVVRSTHPEVLGISYSISEQELLDKTNVLRVQNSQASLVLNPQLSDAARRKAADMFQKDYWAHFAPDGTTPWGFIKAAGYEYAYAGENLAKGFTSSGDVVSAWMDSPSHRENMLSRKYKDVGFAIVEGKLQGEDTVLIVEMFASKDAEIAAIPEESQQIVEFEKKPIAKNVTDGQGVAALGKEVKAVPVVDSQKTIRSSITIFLVFIIVILMLDIIIVEKKKIPRIVGHNMDHIILLVLFLLFVLASTNKGIL